jgi:tetratricopeptide (TPR) repeat protein
LVLGDVYVRLGQWEAARSHFEHALDLTRQVHNQNSEGEALVHLAFLACQLGEFQEALKLGEQALPLAEQSADRDLRAYALTGQGRALTGIGRIEEAIVCHKESLVLRHELKQGHLIAEIEALLAHLYLYQDDLEQAGAYIEKVLGYLQVSDQEGHGERLSPQSPAAISQNSLLFRQLKGVQDPFQVYLICGRVLRAKGDDRSETILAFAANLLSEYANLFDDYNLRKSFLEDVPVNRQISSTYTL